MHEEGSNDFLSIMTRKSLPLPKIVKGLYNTEHDKKIADAAVGIVLEKLKQLLYEKKLKQLLHEKKLNEKELKHLLHEIGG